MIEWLQGVVGTIAAQFVTMSRLDVLLSVVCLVLAGYASARLWTVGTDEEIETRLRTIKRGTTGPQATETFRLDRDSHGPTPWYNKLGAAIARTTFVGATDRVRLGRLLGDAGLESGPRALATLIALKLASLLFLVVCAWIAISTYGLFSAFVILRVVLLLGALLVGWRLPDVILERIARARRRRIELALPDALDLMVISAEAGLSFEQGIEFVAHEMGAAMRDLADEFAKTSAELRVLGDRRQALQNLADRVNLQAVRSIVATLTQTMRYGTPLAQSLRILAAEMRTARLLKMEERAARMPVLLTLPLMGFILPSLVIVCTGPAILQGIDGFRQIMPH